MYRVRALEEIGKGMEDGRVLAKQRNKPFFVTRIRVDKIIIQTNPFAGCVQRTTSNFCLDLDQQGEGECE